MSTPGFQGARLREARESRELTMTALAALLDLSKQLISDFESGAKSPSHETLGRIAYILRFPRQYFTSHISSDQDAIVFYRSLASTTKAARARAEKHLLWAKRVGDLLREHVAFPAVNFPDLNPPENPAHLSRRHIENFATEVRRFWGLGDGPIGNVVWLLENNGAVILRRELGDECLDAYSQWRKPEDRPYFVLGTDKESAARSRLNACHELAHMVLHRHVHRSVHQQSDMFKLMEEQAQHFAGAFLLPATSFASACYMFTLDMFRTLKSHWRVSIGAMIHRAAELDLIDKNEAKRLHINLTRRGWRTCEPLDNEIPCEEPRLIRRAIDAVLENRLMSEQDFEVRLGIYRGDVEAAIGLAPGELGGSPDPFKLPAIQPRPSEPGLFPPPTDIAPIPFKFGYSN